MAVLDIDSVHAFVLVADLGSFTKAAAALEYFTGRDQRQGQTPGRQAGLSTPGSDAEERRLSTQGMTFLKPARNLITAHELAVAGLSADVRRIAIGISDQIAGPGLPALLRKLSALDPGLIIEVHINSSPNLMEAFDKEEFDAAIVRREDDRRDGELLVKERFGWFASPQWELVSGQPLRLASIAKSCGVRSDATKLLDKAGIPWREVFIGGGMPAIGAAVSAGLAVAPLAYSVAPVGTLDVGHRYGLPRLPDSDVILHSTVTDPVSQEALKMLAAAFRTRYASTSTGTRKHHPPIPS